MITVNDDIFNEINVIGPRDIFCKRSSILLKRLSGELDVIEEYRVTHFLGCELLPPARSCGETTKRKLHRNEILVQRILSYRHRITHFSITRRRDIG